MDDPKNQGPGDVTVTHCNIISTDGKQTKDFGPRVWNTIILTESMGLLQGDAIFISGEITIVDAAGLFNEMKFSGDEKIELRFKTPQKEEIEFIGKVYHINVSDFDTKRSATLKFVSAEKILAEQIKFNRAYRDVLYSDMAQDIFSSLNPISQKKIYAEPTKNKGSLIINNKSPVDALTMIAKVARSSNYMGANYVFFEQVGGVFQFASIESLVDPTKVDSSMIYFYGPPPAGIRSLDKLKQIKSYTVLSMPNIVTNVQRGMYAGTTVSNDLIKRQIGYSTFNYDESYSNYKSVNFNEVGSSGKTTLLNNKNYSQRNEGYVHFIPKHFKSFDTDTNHGDEREDSLLVRNSQLQQINAIRLQLVVAGDSQRKVGEVIEVVIPAVEKKTTKVGGRKDLAFSGRYLVTKVKHVVASASGGYETIMMLTKDSYAEPLPVKV
jgi:hypothetical protein